MHVISRKRLVDFWDKHQEAKDALAAWFRAADKANWEKWADVQKAYPKASYFECCLVFNVRGGEYRLIVKRSSNWKTLFVIGVFTHAEYDRDLWKRVCPCRKSAEHEQKEGEAWRKERRKQRRKE